VTPIIDEQSIRLDEDKVEDDEMDLGWATVLKRTFEAYVRGERPNMVRSYLSFSLRRGY
jgi:WD repeat and SOF domain-containing protein 1